jgi:hypothetical protein
MTLNFTVKILKSDLINIHFLKKLLKTHLGLSIMYFGHMAKITIGTDVITRNHVQSLTHQNTIGMMLKPTVHPTHCNIAILPRSSSFDVSIAIINGLRNIDILVSMAIIDAAANRM